MGDVEKREGHQKLLRQQTILARFGELALRSDDLDEVLTQACHLVGEALGTDLAKVVELQEDGETLLVRAGVGWKPDIVGKATIQLQDDTSEAHALRTGKPLISSDIAKETRFKYPSFLIDNGVRAVANVIIIGGQDKPPFGILQIDSRKPRQGGAAHAIEVGQPTLYTLFDGATYSEHVLAFEVETPGLSLFSATFG